MFAFENAYCCSTKAYISELLILEGRLSFPTKGDSFKNFSPVCMSITLENVIGKKYCKSRTFFSYKMGGMTKSFTWVIICRKDLVD